MNAQKKMNIDFRRFDGPVYTGRSRGERLREQLKLDKIDFENFEIEVVIPEDTYTVTSSFFLGLFGPSVVRLGSKDAFYRKFHFKTPEFLRQDLDGYIARALQGRNVLG